jgi:hypothetical protein
MASRTTSALAILLVASAAANVWFLKARRAPAPAPQCPPVEAASAAPGEDAAACEARLAAAEARLAACERRGWEAVRKVIAEDHAARADAGKPAPANNAGPSAQKTTLCTAAQAHLRETWQRDRELIIGNLMRSLNDSAEQERDVTREVSEMAETAGLGLRDTANLDRLYREAREKRIAAVREGLAKQPPDLGAVLSATHGLFADEDALLAQIGGEPARQAWRERQVESRTVLMALWATMADQEWDESIRW